MAVGFMSFVFFDSLFLGIDKMLVEQLMKLQDSSIVIYSKEYDEDKKSYPLDRPIKDINEILKISSSIKNIEALTPRTQFLCEVIYLGKSKHIIATVIEPKTDVQVFDLHKNLKEGKFLDDTSALEILVGSALAEELNIKVKDTITLSAYTKYKMLNALDFVVCGILETSVPLINESTVVINFKSAEKLLDLEGDVNSIHIKVPWNKRESISGYFNKVSKIAKQFKEGLSDDYKVYTFKDLYQEFMLLMKQKRISSFIIVFFILLISAVGIVNTMLMAVYERVKEIGIMMAMGFKPKQVRNLFLLEGLIIGLFGSALGAFLGLLSNLWLIYKGWNLEIMYGEKITGLKASQLGMPVWGVIYGEWNIYAFVFCFCFCILIAVISAYFPSRFASKLTVTDCLKFI